MSDDFDPSFESLPEEESAYHAGEFDIEPTERALPVERPRGVGAAFGVGAVAAAALVTFGFQNTASVPIQFLWFDGKAPLWLAMGSAAIVAVVVVKVIGFAIRGRRRRAD